MTTCPLIAGGDLDTPMAWRDGKPTSRRQFLADVQALAARLPGAGPMLNATGDRYRFAVGLGAAMLRGQSNVMPPNHTTDTVVRLCGLYPSSYSLTDAPGTGLDLPTTRHAQTLASVDDATAQAAAPEIDENALTALVLTSGSTGTPVPHPKHWGLLVRNTEAGARRLAEQMGRADLRGVTLVATVPPQHMYGMELSVLLPLIGPAAVHAARPFFPADVARVLAEIPEPRLLVTTPVHLRALVQSGVELPVLCGIVSATAPLSMELALAAEESFGCEVRELFGSTETCIIARRRPAFDSAWTPLSGVRVQPRPDGALVHAAHLPVPVALADLVEVEDDGRFHLRGRQADLLEIAGKRASLGDLTRRLLAIPGVVDGVMLQLDAGQGQTVGRVAALVVAPTLDEGVILAALRQSVDPVFLPRPLKRVEALPRSDAGKLPRAELLRLF